MRRFLIVSAAGLLALAAGAIGAASGYRAYAPRHPDQSHALRVRAIASQAAQAGHVETLIVGDSLVELAYIPAICGGSTLNAGIGGARLADVAAILPGLLRATRPTRVVLAVGVNDASRAEPLSSEAFSRRYAGLIQAAKAGGATVSVATIAPVADQGPLGAGYFSRARLAKFNASIRRLAEEHGVPVADMNSLADPTGALPASLTVDGVHLAPAGYARWQSAINNAC